MKLKIKETGEVKELKLIDPTSGCDCSANYVVDDSIEYCNEP